MSDATNTDTRLILPALRPLYSALAPLSETLMRVVAGFALAMHGWPKIQAPMGTAEMVAGLGFAPAALFSPLLAITEFFGGIFLMLGLLTRPVAVAATFVLLVTVYVHWVVWAQGYSGAELSLIWASVTLFFAVRGGGPLSVDRLIGRQF